MKERLFRFKQFSVAHHQSAMKVGVDGVLIGAWATSPGERVLDVGTGCGVIALMMAQRYPGASVLAIDIDSPSVNEARENIHNSPWNGRIEVKEETFDSLCARITAGEEERYDLVVSNPPYYDSGVADTSDSRLRARHQGELSPAVLLRKASGILKEGGGLSMIFPAEMYSSLAEEGERHGMIPARVCYVRDHAGAEEKRVMAEFIRYGGAGSITLEETHLVMFGADKEPTPDYRELCREFYLRF